MFQRLIRLRSGSNVLGHTLNNNPPPPIYTRHHVSRRLKGSSAATESSKAPLAGIHILDFGRILAAPFCSQILADYGADVIKIEQPKTGDETRGYRITNELRKWKPEAQPMSFYFAALNRNKRSITLDLKRKAGVEVVHRLVETADVVLENFIPGRGDKLGIRYAELSKINPGLIYCSLSGYGHTGPDSGRAGYDAIATAEGGLQHITGDPKGPPVRPGLGMIDMSTGLFAHGAIMAALRHRDQTGKGQHIDCSLFGTQISMLVNIGANWLNMQHEGQRFGSGHPSIHPVGVWQCKDGMYLTLSITNDRQFKLLRERLGHPELPDDVGFATNDMRVAKREKLDEILSQILREKGVDEWMRIFEGSGLAIGPVNTIQKAFEHPQTQARDMVQSRAWDAVESGEWKAIGSAVKFSEIEPEIRRLPPKLGEHTEEILAEAGYTREEIERLRRDGIF
ncbi:uncharacterized protein MYCFIDRAFT_137416 [Pseudocercospora fijiensis CIRAD86]|uniref:CoA-transferase family III n=1 Tax=Pseudocercospora fijiensis (strain CIRAD86) TaxID=383855 RepID=M2ZXG6_PSEFD|nr:uncharacterized protein MYCFIDRAFT_137416 [Pseudocercospora fijiensis CIRAD86]EME83679.1 hypothetical protein MYCFIDRAFT_137416 [Pseudocercospora fijiensis CIRAD86]